MSSGCCAVPRKLSVGGHVLIKIFFLVRLEKLTPDVCPSVVDTPRVCIYIYIYIYIIGRDSAVGIATRYGLDCTGIECRRRVRFSAPVQTGPGDYPASYTMGTGSFPGVKGPGRGV